VTSHSQRRKETPNHLSVGTRLEQACDAFEAEWKTGQRPQIEDYLNAVPQSDQWTFLRELLLLDLDYRNRVEDDEVTHQEYEQRFPDFADLISHVFNKPRGGAPTLKRVRDYKLLKKIGEGGMGVVYKARHMRLGKIRAVKVLPQHLLDNEEVLERFRLEVENSGRLEHPNIVQALDAGEEDGVHFLVMEYVDGYNLDELIQKHGRLTVGAACEVIRQAAVGLQHADELFLVHRDIKPSNLMLTRSGRVKILDLGLARLIAEQGVASRITLPGGAMGTMDYMAPEQWEDASSVDIRADIYSLGCTLYYLLTAKVPYGGETISSALKKQKAHREDPVPSVLAERADAPQELQAVIDRLMAKDLEQRYATPTEVIHAVGKFADRDDLGRLPSVEPDPAGSPQTVTTPRIATSLSDTRKRHPQQPAKLRPWYRRGKFQALVATAVVLLAVLAFLMFRPGPDPALQALRTDLGAMPGLNGEWWFDETPWFAPCIRAEVIKGIDQHGARIGGVSLESLSAGVHGSDVASFYGRLKVAANKLSQSDALPGQQRRLIQELASRDQFDRPEAEYLSELESIAGRLQAIEGPSSTQLHLLAVIQHKLQQREDAERSYQEAIELYRQADYRVLHALCVSDYARMLIDWNDEKARQGIPWCREARKGVACPALQVVTL
jgi:serine/threonine protein kinase